VKIASVARSAAVSALLGLPVALIAHALVFGQAHAMGGERHGLAVYAAIVFSAAAAVICGLRNARSKHARSLPPTTLLFTAGAWFATFELTETTHAVPVLLCAAAIVFAAAICGFALRAYAHTVHAIACIVSARKEYAPSAFVCRFSPGAFNMRHVLCAFSLFSRPPPLLS
jgi:hypothetical protein